MANTKSTAKPTKTNNINTIDKLQSQLEMQQKQIEDLMKIINAQSQVVTNTNISTSNNNDINADEEILLVSLTPNKLNLVGDNNTILFSFEKMYEEQYVDYASLKEIVRLNRQMAKNGRFYIMDERAVSKLRLKNDYKNILTPEQLKDILGNNVRTAVELYKLAPAGQQATIIEMVKQKKFSGANIDYNLLRELSEICGVDLANIEDATQIEINN